MERQMGETEIQRQERQSLGEGWGERPWGKRGLRKQQRSQRERGEFGGTGRP